MNNYREEFTLNNTKGKAPIGVYRTANRLGGNAPQLVADYYGRDVQRVIEAGPAVIEEEKLKQILGLNDQGRIITVLSLGTSRKALAFIPEALYSQGYKADNIAGGYADGSFHLFKLPEDGRFEPVKRAGFDGEGETREDYLGIAGLIHTSDSTLDVARALIYGEI